MSKLARYLRQDTSPEGIIFEYLVYLLRACAGAAIFLYLGTKFLNDNERNHIKTLKGVSEGIASVNRLTSLKFDPANNDKLVFFTGKIENDIPLVDMNYEISTNSLALYRTVEMFQWKETYNSRSTVGSKYSYDIVWSENFYPTSAFREPGHINPEAMPIRSKSKIAKRLRAGDFILSNRFQQKLKNTKIIDPSEIKNIPPLNGISSTITKDYIYYGNPGHPQVGDIRVKIEVIPSTEMSVIGRQSADRVILPFTSKSGEKLTPIEVGSIAPDKMFLNIKEKANLRRWSLRACFFIILFIGFRFFAVAFVLLTKVAPKLGKFYSVSDLIVGFVLTLPYYALIIAYARSDYNPELSYSITAVVFGFLALAILKTKFSNQKKKTIVNSNTTQSGGEKPEKKAA